MARLQASRFEMKYIITEDAARFMREYVLTHLVPDEHSRPDQKHGYPVKSLYLDTRDLKLYRQTGRAPPNLKVHSGRITDYLEVIGATEEEKAALLTQFRQIQPEFSYKTVEDLV